MRNLILTGGIRHDFADNTRAVIALLAEAGIESEATEDIDAGIASLSEEHYDLVTVMALRWRMEGDPKYAPYRAAWAYHMPEPSRQGLQRHVAHGGGLLGLHTACLCFDDWDDWREVLGGRWTWGQSFHPPRGPITVSPLRQARTHPLTRGLPEFQLEDEVFSALSLARDVTPLLNARATNADVSGQPVLWARQEGDARIVYDALGHDRESLENAVHRRILQRSALWAGKASDDTVTGF
ncbi:ThuA domain-containing protein [Oceanibacterium hippocampi]|uniref:Trehalose utilization n=1 Tax=Oceanibacterium hippocampi TaxID=745714 RepID=A0A1Y5TZG7_9PROT|nr:ThuA domain-containing protein [Oceanibacterium hippocampi]SLN72122.1 Trehalose utilization [Oceanibacterium hippocampi]